MSELKKIEQRIAELETRLTSVRGRETEIYSRIVGYYRSVKNWNKGKREEYNHRQLFQGTLDERELHTELPAGELVKQGSSKDAGIIESPEVQDSMDTFAFFYRDNCPNCPPVKHYIETLEVDGRFVNVDDDKGLQEAQALEILASPTVVFFDSKGEEIMRATSLEAVKEAFVCV